MKTETKTKKCDYCGEETENVFSHRKMNLCEKCMKDVEMGNGD